MPPVVQLEEHNLGGFKKKDYYKNQRNSGKSQITP